MNAVDRRIGAATRLATVAVGIAMLASCSGGQPTGDDDLEGVDVALASGSAAYAITAGDTLSGIAGRASVSLDALVAANGWSDGSNHLIIPGDVISLPEGAELSARGPSASAATTETARTGSTTAPTDDNRPIDENGFLECDSQAIIAAIGDPDFVTFDEVGCENGWAGAGYLDSENFYTPVILRAEGQRWVLQDWMTVCDRYPDITNQAKLYCPGG